MTKRRYLGCLAGMLLILPGCGHEKSVSASEPAAHAKPSSTHLSKNYVYGQISGISANQWTINSIHGHIYTAHLTSATMYGDIFKPQHRSDFKIGDDVRVAGEFVGTAIAATAVEHGVHKD